MPGCNLLAAPTLTFPLTNLGGFANWAARIPSAANLVGVSVYTQGVVADPSANQLGFAMSNASELELGSK